MHVNNVVLAVVKGGRGHSAGRHRGSRGFQCVGAKKARSTKSRCMATDCYSLLLRDGLMTGVAHTDRKLKAHEGDRGAVGRTLGTHCFTALPAVVLPKK